MCFNIYRIVGKNLFMNYNGRELVMHFKINSSYCDIDPKNVYSVYSRSMYRYCGNNLFTFLGTYVVWSYHSHTGPHNTLHSLSLQGTTW